jgi:hypothetical protein
MSKGAGLLHNNAHPHTANETHTKLNFEVTEHPPYNPNLATSDHHWFGPFKEALRC